MDSSSWIDCYEESALAALRLGKANASLRVPSCPAWTGLDLATHVAGQTLGWSVMMTWDPEAGTPDFAQVGAEVEARFPSAAADPLSRGEAQIRDFAAQLRNTDPQASAWTLWPPHTAGFWMRRAAMEDVVHRWDAEGIAGVPAPIDVAVACDGIDELVDAMIPFWLSVGQAAPTRTVEISASDGSRTWTIQGSDAVAQTARVSGRVSDLFLALWSRGSDQLEGEVDVLGSWAALGTIF